MNDGFYFPLLRGKTYECLAVRQMLERGDFPESFSPIFEPVSSADSLVSLAKEANKHKRAFGVVINPSVGPMANLPLDNSFYEGVKLFAVKYGWRIYVRADSVDLRQLLNKYRLESTGRIGFILDPSLDVFELNDHLDADPTLRAAYFVADLDIIQDLEAPNRIRLTNFFKRKNSNAEYVNQSVEPIPPIYQSAKRNNIGYSDYSVIGEEYSDTGMGPVTIAFHIVFPTEKNRMALIHFVSYPDISRKDPGARFYNAVQSFVEWNDKTGHLTNKAALELISCYKMEKYPGLGSLKRIQIQQHFEILDEVLQSL